MSSTSYESDVSHSLALPIVSSKCVSTFRNFLNSQNV